jgi:type II secretory pathway component GspD/PulD (secretin)
VVFWIPLSLIEKRLMSRSAYRWLSAAYFGLLILGTIRAGSPQEVSSGDTPLGQPTEQAPRVIRVDGPAAAGVISSTTEPTEAKPGEVNPEESSSSAIKGDAKDTAKKEEKPGIVQRPITPPASADPTELEIRPGADGRVRFNFRGQPWPDVLDWLATVSGLSLDWQELPGDYLNLLTQRSYTVDQARDLVNRHLLARGFTLLVVDEVMTVVKTDGINAALVPRVEPEDLASRLPHEYVKVSFPLDWLIAEAAVEELKPMLSPNGKLTALKSTNRLEALDAATNLRELHEVLTREQSVAGQERLVREFVLMYARATDVSEQLKGLLGLDTKSRGPQLPMTPQQMEQMQQQQQQQQQMMMQMQQQQQQQRGGRPAMPGPRPQEDVNLVVNPRRNSVLVHAPPDKLAIIAKAVEVIDVPLDRDQSLLLNVNRMQVYRLAQLDPESLIRTLQDCGDLDPTTRLEPDRKNNAVIAYAPLTDHLTIRMLVGKLDGSGRQFEVIPLRRLEADYVAGTITFMMGQEPKTEQQPRYFGYWDGRSRPTEESARDKFRVDADVAGNRLLVWANDVEMEEVRKLLVKLGEIPAQGGNLERVRVLDVHAGDATGQLLEQIRRAWPALAPNPIVLPSAQRLSPPGSPETEPEETDKADDSASSAPDAGDLRATHYVPSTDLIHFTQLNAIAPRTPEQPSGDHVAPADQVPAPVQIAIGPDGRLVISSQDTAALDLLEELLSQLAPARKDFKIFPLKYASAFWVKLNLQDYFKEQPEDTGRRRNYYFDYPPPDQKERSYRLSQRRPLKFIEDLDTNTILVVGASAEQLQVIEDLIQLWDAPPPSDTQSARLTSMFALQYSKAETIAETLKEVYLDLLSSNDRHLQQRDRDEKRATSQTTYIFGEGGTNEPDRRTQVSFKGKLSIGVDPISNTLLVSTEGQTLMDNVSRMIQALDEAAKPVSEVRVVALQGNINAQRIRQVLSDMLLENSVHPASAPVGNLPPGGAPAAIRLPGANGR